MNTILCVGVILFAGFVLGAGAHRLGLPKITGYIIAGILLNPRVLPLIPDDFTQHTDFVTDMSLAFITFAVGGTLLLSEIRRLGKAMLIITAFEAQFAFAAVMGGFALLLLVFGIGTQGLPPAPLWAMALLLGALAAPTDPSATLAVAHEYKAKGEVTSAVMGVAAFDDVFGIMNYSVAMAVAKLLLLGTAFSFETAAEHPAVQVVGGIAIGLGYGLAFNGLTRLTRGRGEGTLIVIVFALLLLCFGTARLVGWDELLATMTMGAVVVNLNPERDAIFALLERYTEELIFVLFFVVSGMHLDLAAMWGALGMIGLLAVLRTLGKFAGTMLGAAVAGAPPAVRKYTAFGLIPQGGIVIGMALMLQGRPAFAGIADTLISVIIGATVVHVLAGPLLARAALKRAGEIQ